MKKTYVYYLIAIIVLFVAVSGIRALIRFNKNRKEEVAWKIYQIAISELDRGKAGDAIASCEKALPDLITPAKRGSCLGIYGEALLKEHSKTEAMEKLDEAVKLNPADFRTRMVLGKIYYDDAKGKEKDAAEALYKKSLSEYNEALKYCRKEDFQTRENKYYQIMQTIKYYQGDILEKFKNFGDAKLKYEELMEIVEKHPDSKMDFVDEVQRRLDLMEKE